MPAVCETKDVCPPWKDPDSSYVAQNAEACTHDAMLPTGFELDSGKRFSCECRCAMLPPCKLIFASKRSAVRQGMQHEVFDHPS